MRTPAELSRAIAVLAIVLAAQRAVADPAPAWAAGVSETEQDTATKLFDEGNQLFAQQAHAPALQKYQEALSHWEHPLIEFNLAVTLIRLDRILEAADALDKALRYNAEPFTKTLYQQALDYQALLKGRVGIVAASCTQTDAHVLLDGKPWFECPGSKQQRVLAGEHAIVGERAQYITSSQRLVVTGGATATAKVELVPLDNAVQLVYPHRRWIPWTIAGSGAAIVVIGLGAWLTGRSDMDRYQTQLEATCATGCPADLAGNQYSLLRSARDSGTFDSKLGVGLISAGGAVIVTGVVMAIVNRPRRVLPNVEVAPKPGGLTMTVGTTF